MIPASFQYHKAASVDDALNLLASGEAKLLAGGHSLVPAMKLRLAKPEHLVDLNGITELRTIKRSNGQLSIGAMATHTAVHTSQDVRSAAPFIAAMAGNIGDISVRNRGTIGGSIAHADPRADYPAALLAAGATIVISGKQGTRSVPADDFFVDMFTTALQEHEIITGIHIPVLAKGEGAAYTKFPHPASRYAIVGVGARLTVASGMFTNVRIALTGLIEKPFRDNGVESALEGKPATADSIEAAAALAAKNVDVTGDHFADEAYRRHLAIVQTRKALTEAFGQATA
jgi:carbon-monoxide dehydrogenase medium subunit